MLIRDVAYGGLAKGERARLHRAFAGWLRARSADELVEAQAYHLERAASLSAELEGQIPADLRAEAADVLERAGCRALDREANRTARRLLLRAIELEPSLERQFYAARAAWRLWELPAASLEMEDVRSLAKAAGDRTIEGLALTQLAEIDLNRNADVERGRALGLEALELLVRRAGRRAVGGADAPVEHRVVGRRPRERRAIHGRGARDRAGGEAGPTSRASR